jgi:hypothetical protein
MRTGCERRPASPPRRRRGSARPRQRRRGASPGRQGFTEVVGSASSPSIASPHLNADAHRQRHSSPPALTIDRAAWRRRTRPRRRALEGDHQPVAESLDLASVVGGDSVAQRAEVAAQQRLALDVPERGEQLRRADEIGEEECEYAGRHAYALRRYSGEGSPAMPAQRRARGSRPP